MDKYGPLYARNGAKLWPQWLARFAVTVAILVGVAEVVCIIGSALG